MAGPVDEQLAQLAALHDRGALTDAEFADAKASTLSPVSGRGADAPTRRAITGTEALARFPLVWMILAALVAGFAVQSIGTVVEWGPIQAVAGPLVCPGAEFSPGFDASYTVNRKGVTPSAACERDGTVTDVSAWTLSGVLTAVYALPILASLLLVRAWARRKLASSPSPSPGSGPDD